jgi:hypothetical protein
MRPTRCAAIIGLALLDDLECRLHGLGFFNRDDAFLTLSIASAMILPIV